MSILTAVFYGIVQGITEFLPVSSSGHLSLLQDIFGMDNLEATYFTFDILLHLATLAAVFIVFWRDIFPLIPAFFTMVGKLIKKAFTSAGRKAPLLFTSDEKFCGLIIIATLPLFAAVFISDYVQILYGSGKIIGGILIFNGIMLFISDMLSHGRKGIDDVKPQNALVVGLCQMCAIIPGLSRSGATITGGLSQGFSRELAVKFSFILSIPAILGANILELPDMFKTPVPSTDIAAYAAGMIAAALAGIAAMKLLIYISKKANFRIFGIYCIIVGIAAVIFA